MLNQPLLQALQAFEEMKAQPPMPPGIGGFAMQMPQIAQFAMNAPGFQAQEDLDAYGNAEDEYLRMASEPMPERQIKNPQPTALGAGLSLLGEFLARSMDRDAYQPGQVLGGYMGGLNQRAQQEQAQEDERLKAEMARRQQMLAGQQLKMRGAERQASRSDKFLQEFRDKQFKASQAGLDREFKAEQANEDRKGRVMQALTSVTNLADFEATLAIAKSQGFQLDPVAEDRARRFLQDKDRREQEKVEIAQRGRQLGAQSEWRRILADEAKLDGLVSDADIPALMQQRELFAQQFGVPVDVLQVPKPFETLQRERYDALKQDADRRFTQLERKIREDLSLRKAQFELAKMRESRMNELGWARINESARQANQRELRLLEQNLGSDYERAAASLRQKLRAAEANFNILRKANRPDEAEKARIKVESLREEISMLERERVEALGENASPMPGPAFQVGGGVQFKGPAEVSIPGLSGGIPYRPRPGQQPPTQRRS